MASKTWKVRAQLRGAGPWLELAALGVLMLVGLALRLRGLDAWWPNPDEGLHFGIATEPDLRSFWQGLEAEAHPPLYLLAIYLLGRLGFGIDAMRQLSVGFGVLAIPALWLATRVLAGRGAALLAAAVVAVAPLPILLSQLVRPYAMQLPLLGGALAFGVRTARGGANRDLAAFALCAAAAVLTHYSSILFLAVLAAVLGCDALARGAGIRTQARLALGLLPAAASAGVSWTVNLSRRFQGPGELALPRQDWLQPFFAEDWAGAVRLLIETLRYAFGAAQEALVLLLLAMGLAAAFARRAWILAGAMLLAFAVAVTLSRLHVHPLGPSRHATWILPLVIPCLALGARVLLPGRSPLRWLGAALLLAVALQPRMARHALGLDRIPERFFAEHVIPRADVNQMRYVLDALPTSGAPVLMDLQTYYSLLPLLHPARLALRGDGDGRGGAFGWGETTVVVSDAWRLRFGAEDLALSDHGFGFLRATDAAHPELRLRERPTLYLVAAGWGAEGLRALSRMDRRLAGPACVERIELRTGIGWARLDAARCLAKLRSQLG